jgi:hypothetical protein
MDEDLRSLATQIAAVVGAAFVGAAGIIAILLSGPPSNVSVLSDSSDPFLSLTPLVLGIACLFGAYLIHRDVE